MSQETYRINRWQRGLISALRLGISSAFRRSFTPLVLAGVAALTLTPQLSAGQTFATIHSFDGSSNGGKFPQAGVTFDSQGNMYGTANSGGAYGKGMVWEITATGNFVDLHDFGSIANDGSGPMGAIAIDSSGNLYGTTESGGASVASGGTVWEIPSGGNLEVLYSFGDSSNGMSPKAGVTLYQGKLYGTTTSFGSCNQGNVWQLTPGTSGWSAIDLFDFGTLYATGSPLAGVTFDAQGNMYGTTGNGGNRSGGGVIGGTLWEIPYGGSMQVLYNFGEDTVGDAPGSNVIIDSLGNLYGTTSAGGAGGGSIWEFTTSQTCVALHQFADSDYGPDGYAAMGQIVLDNQGDLFGTTYGGGTYGSGAVWEYSTSTSTYTLLESVLNSIQGPEGVTMDPLGNLFGTTQGNGSNSNFGSVWGISLGASSVVISPSSVAGGLTATATITLSQPAPADGLVLNVSTNSADISIPASVTIPAGATSATFQVGTAPVIVAENTTVTVNLGLSSKTASLCVLPAAVSSVALTPNTVFGGSSVTGTVTLTGPAAQTMSVMLWSSSASAQVPITVSIPAGQSSATFTITTSQVSGVTTPTITAMYNAVSATSTFTIDPTVASFFLDPNEVQAGRSCTAEIKLSGPAPAGGLTVKLSSIWSILKFPATVVVPENATSVTFKVETKSWTGWAPEETTITAQTGVVKATGILLVTF